MKNLCYLLAFFLLLACSENNTQSKTERGHETDTLNSGITNEEKVKVLWRDSSAKLVINQTYCKGISEPEKAAIGYVATFVGNDCEWEGNTENLKCSVISALNLGYQCSETHLGFLRNWFKGDTAVLNELENCPQTPNTATVQESFDELEISSNGNTIVVFYKASGINLREGKSWNYSEVVSFEKDNERIRLKNKERSEVKMEQIQE
ncbi:MAG: hypothetical protein LCH37_01930 [Bacteroidetes bacterium]|nr:hypothetical protein [Bacteroidota bacterium]